MDNTKVMACDCKHEYQDATYGKGQRVHNRGKGNTKDSVQYTCTVCGKVK